MNRPGTTRLREVVLLAALCSSLNSWTYGNVVRHAVGKGYDEFAFAAVFYRVVDGVAAFGDIADLGLVVALGDAFLQDAVACLLRLRPRR